MFISDEQYLTAKLTMFIYTLERASEEKKKKFTEDFEKTFYRHWNALPEEQRKELLSEMSADRAGSNNLAATKNAGAD